MKLVLNSYAKLNLYLAVLGKRSDGYHNIKTVFEKIDLHDRIILKPRPDNKIKIISSQKSGLPKDASFNLAYRAAKLLQDRFHIHKGIEIKLIKRIPIGSGLGGGSSNAAVVLLGLNRLWKLNLRRNRLLELARELGSDVPFFIYNVSFAQGSFRGDKIRPLDSLKKLKLWHILVVPRLNVSTQLIYNKWDTFKSFKLTRPRYDVKILNSGLKKNALSLIAKALFNSLEEITARLYPRIKTIKGKLRRLGLKAILMSGSGPAVFGIVSSRKEALSLYRQLGKEDRWGKIFVARTT